MTAGADRWIRWTTIGCVALLAVIAGTVSYLHMHTLVARHGQPGWVAATGQAIDEPACPVPLPGEPASHLSLGRDHGGTDRSGDELLQGFARIGVAAARGGMGLIPADPARWNAGARYRR